MIYVDFSPNLNLFLMNTVETFRQLHQQEKPLLLANVWDAHTAKLAQKAGFQALGSSSHAIANFLGYEDGENITFEQLFYIVKHIRNVAEIPLSVDFEAGYSDDPQEVARYAKELAEIGVLGINIEDGVVKDGKRSLGDADLLATKIKAIKDLTNIFINARIDTYTTKHPDSLKESISRALQYQEAGADGVFVPLIQTEADLQTFTSKVSIPLNVFVTPDLPDYETLTRLGVKRISHGAKQYEVLMKKSEEIFQDFAKTKNYKKILEG
jgi:2-methylisocitrate lyase-like PEP mutase family enzyme